MIFPLAAAFSAPLLSCLPQLSLLTFPNSIPAWHVPGSLRHAQPAAARVPPPVCSHVLVRLPSQTLGQQVQDFWVPVRRSCHHGKITGSWNCDGAASDGCWCLRPKLFAGISGYLCGRCHTSFKSERFEAGLEWGYEATYHAETAVLDWFRCMRTVGADMAAILFGIVSLLR